MFERLLITFALMLSFGALLLIMKRRQIVSANRASRQLHEPAPRPTIVYFWSHGCPVCKMTQRRILDNILAEYGKEHIALTAYNIDEAPDAAKEWGVMTLPTTFLVDSAGAVKHVNNGLAAEETLRGQLAAMMSR